MFKKSPTGPTIPAPVYLVAPATGSKGGLPRLFTWGQLARSCLTLQRIYISGQIRATSARSPKLILKLTR